MSDCTCAPRLGYLEAIVKGVAEKLGVDIPAVDPFADIDRTKVYTIPQLAKLRPITKQTLHRDARMGLLKTTPSPGDMASTGQQFVDYCLLKEKQRGR